MALSSPAGSAGTYHRHVCPPPKPANTHTHAQSAEHCSRLVAPGCWPYFSAPSLMERQVADRHNNQRGGAKNTTIEHTQRHTHTPVSLLFGEAAPSKRPSRPRVSVNRSSAGDPEEHASSSLTWTHLASLLAGLSRMVQSSPACLHSLAEAAEENYVDRDGDFALLRPISARC